MLADPTHTVSHTQYLSDFRKVVMHFYEPGLPAFKCIKKFLGRWQKGFLDALVRLHLEI